MIQYDGTTDLRISCLSFSSAAFFLFAGTWTISTWALNINTLSTNDFIIKFVLSTYVGVLIKALRQYGYLIQILQDRV